MVMFRKLLESRHGNVTVETALMFLVITSISLGAFELGRIFYSKSHLVTEKRHLSEDFSGSQPINSTFLLGTQRLHRLDIARDYRVHPVAGAALFNYQLAGAETLLKGET